MAESEKKIDFFTEPAAQPADPVDPVVAEIMEKMRLSAKEAVSPGPTKSERIRMISRWKGKVDGR